MVLLRFMALKTISFLFLSATLSLLLSHATYQENPLLLDYNCDYTKGNYTVNSPYHLNLLNAFSNLTSLSSFNVFSTFTAGSNEDATSQVYALYDCRDDLTHQTCHTCVKDAATNLLQLCPAKEAIAVYEECMLRYANRPIFGMMELTPYSIVCGGATIPDRGELNMTIEPVFIGLIDQATSENSSQYFAVGEESYFEYQKVYCLVQCTPDIGRKQCKECLLDALNYTLKCANGSQLISLHTGPSCQMRYDIVPFLNNVSPNMPPMASPTILSPHVLKTGDGGQRLNSIESFISILLPFIMCSVNDIIC